MAYVEQSRGTGTQHRKVSDVRCRNQMWEGQQPENYEMTQMTNKIVEGVNTRQVWDGRRRPKLWSRIDTRKVCFHGP